MTNEPRDAGRAATEAASPDRGRGSGDGLEELGRDECLRLLPSAEVGRAAVHTPEGFPMVVPVNFVLDGELVVFRTGPGDKLSALRQHPMSFEVDAVDPVHRTGWSVLVQGVASEALPGEVAHLTVEPWAGGEKQHWVRLVPRRATGRRITLPEIRRDPRGYL